VPERVLEILEVEVASREELIALQASDHVGSPL
jgi:hypothetical protein